MTRCGALAGVQIDLFEDEAPALPPVAVPSPAELLDAATGNTVLRRLTGFVGWVGDGRALAADGALSPADARAAAAAVGLDAGRLEFVLLVRWRVRPVWSAR